MRMVPTLCLLFTSLLYAADPNTSSRTQEIEDYVARYQQMAAFDGVVLIAVGDEVVWIKAFGFADYGRKEPISTDNVFRIASLSKQVTQAAIGRLVDRAALSLDAKLSTFLPDFPNAGRISIRQLLDHSAGIAHTNRLDWMDMHDGMALERIVAGMAQEPLLFQPGEGSQYSNGGYALLAKVIEIAGDLSYGEFIDTEFGSEGYPSLGHEDAFESIDKMASRYAPGPVYGERVAAATYVTANRIGGGSLHANAEDVFRFFRDSYSGKLLTAETTAALFRKPDDGDIEITGRSPGALAQIYLDFIDNLTVVTLSSNSAWPGSFNKDIVSLYRGEDTTLTPFTLSREGMTEGDITAVTGQFVAARFGWNVAIEAGEKNLVFVQDEMRTAFARTTTGEFHLPVYDWLCRFGDYGMDFECRQRDPDAAIRFRFARR